MIVGLRSFIRISGTFFSPSRLETTTPLAFTSKLEPGEVAKFGRYRNQPSPFGQGVIEADEHLSKHDQIRFLIDVYTPVAGEARHLGVTEGKLHLSYEWQGQCNLTFLSDVLRDVSALGLSLCISCHESDVSEEEAVPLGGWENWDGS